MMDMARRWLAMKSCVGDVMTSRVVAVRKTASFKDADIHRETTEEVIAVRDELAYPGTPR
jgi:hypothetical protein